MLCGIKRIPAVLSSGGRIWSSLAGSGGVLPSLEWWEGAEPFGRWGGSAERRGRSPRSGAEPSRPQTQPERTHHAFEVADFEGTKQVLAENGFEVLREGIRYDGQAYLFIHDPDGNRVEFCTASGYAPAPTRAAAAQPL